VRRRPVAVAAAVLDATLIGVIFLAMYSGLVNPSHQSSWLYRDCLFEGGSAGTSHWTPLLLAIVAIPIVAGLHAGVRARGWPRVASLTSATALAIISVGLVAIPTGHCIE
jgi:hypothetical protein